MAKKAVTPNATVSAASIWAGKVIATMTLSRQNIANAPNNVKNAHLYA